MRDLAVLSRLVAALAAGLVAAGLLAGCTSTASAPPESSSAQASTPGFDVPCPDKFEPPAATTAKTLPDVKIPCLDPSSDALSLRGTPGVPMLVNMWASWCEPCRAEMKFLDRFAVNAGAKAQVLGVATIDRRSAASTFATDFDLSFPSVFDSDGVLQKAAVLKGLPGTVFVDASGAVVHVQAGPFDSYADLRSKVQQYLGVDVP